MQVYVPGSSRKQMMNALGNLSSTSAVPSGRPEGPRVDAKSNPMSCPSFFSQESRLEQPSSRAESILSVVPHVGMEDVPSCSSDFPERLGRALTFLVARRSDDSALTASSHALDLMTQLFSGSATPSIDISAFCKRLQKYLRCSNETWVRAFVYIDRAASANWHASCTLCVKRQTCMDPVVTGTAGPMILNDKTVHRVLLAALVTGLKMQDDTYYTNSYYAKVGGVSTKELNLLEAGLLKVLDWDVNVSTEEYLRYMRVVCHTSDAVSSNPSTTPTAA